MGDRWPGVQVIGRAVQVTERGREICDKPNTQTNAAFKTKPKRHYLKRLKEMMQQDSMIFCGQLEGPVGCHPQAPGCVRRDSGVTAPIGSGWGPKGRACHGMDPLLHSLYWDWGWGPAWGVGGPCRLFITSRFVSRVRLSRHNSLEWLMQGSQLGRQPGVPSLVTSYPPSLSSKSMALLWVSEAHARSGQVLPPSA
jgi:hypothetical protein